MQHKHQSRFPFARTINKWEFFVRANFINNLLAQRLRIWHSVQALNKCLLQNSNQLKVTSMHEK